MEKFLCVGESGVRMVGVWGIGGLGKTTIAKAVYNSITHTFEGSCFVENVRERSLRSGGLAELQEFLLSKILGLKELKINSLDEGSNMIRERLSHKRVLLIVDDVNDLDQLKSLVGKPDWFGSGSRIIITTRDHDLLRRHDVDQIYQVEKLSDREALELFKINAFKEKEHMSDYIEHIDSVIRYAEGLPLVLEVLGSHLRGISTDTWKDTLEYYKKNPKLQQFLKLSYDALEPLVKEVFLHIACFFKGENRNYVMTILEGCELPKHGIEILIAKALIRITEANGIWMHDLLEEMGKEIVCQESSEPGERSRLWLYKDVCHAFVQKTGTSRVKGIMVKDGKPDQQIPLNMKSFIKLNNLQILIIYGDIFYGDHVKYLPNDLSLLDWQCCPLQYFPSNFYPTKLVVLKIAIGKALSSWGILIKGGFQRKMPWICTSPVGKRLQIMPNLKSLVLQDCHAVTTSSDFPTFPNLEELEISAIEFKKFEIVEEMKSLKRLDLSWASIRELPSSAIRYLTNLEQLTLRSCNKLKRVACNIFELQHLQLLDLSFCDRLVTFPTKSQFSTESATLQDTHYAPLFVYLKGCWNLVEIGEFPREIYGLDVRGCFKLKRISRLSNMLEGKDTRMIPRMNLSRCSAMYHNKRDSEAWGTIKNLPYNYSLFFSCRQSEYEVVFNYDYVPEWFTCRMDVTNVGLQVCNFRIDFPGNFKWEDKGLAFCVPNCYWGAHFSVLRIYINDVSIVDASEKKHDFTLLWGGAWTVWLYYMPFDAIIKRLRESGLPPPSNCLVKFEFQIESIVFEVVRWRSCGVHVVMPEDEGPFVHQLLDNGD